jgi:anaerobic magnesium-protoporphyrin IX monomethyl ester cyclase
MGKKPDITLVFPSSPFLINQKVFPPLGILYLSAYLRRYGLRTECVDLTMLSEPVDVGKWAPIVGISFTTSQRNEAYQLAHMLKSRGKLTIAGGPHPTHMPDECKATGSFDYIIEGQGEAKLLRLMVALTDSRLDPSVQWDYSPPIDDLPFPDRDALPIKEYEYYVGKRLATPIMTSRSCPFSCRFCAKIDNNFRMQSARRTLDEISFLNEKYGYSAFMIFDDCFTADEKRLSAISSELQYRNFKFRCFSRSNLITEDVCFDLARMGVVEVGIGVESGSKAVLDKNMKGTTPAMNSKAVELLHKYKIRVKAFIIVGLPGESMTTVRETRDWLHDNHVDDVDFSIFQPMPGSDIFKHPEQYGITFNYNGRDVWYKGKPGEYTTTVSTGALQPEELVYLRNLLEWGFKNKELLR